MFRKSFILIFGALLAISTAKAQHPDYPFRYMIGFSWDVNVPINNSFVSKTSLEGFEFDYRHQLKENLTAGFEVSFNGFYQYVPRQTYHIQNGAVTTDLYTYIYTLPMAVNIHHYFDAGKHVKPYAGLAIGANYSEQKIYYNTYVSQDENWGFLIRPEIGAIVKPDPHSGFGILLGARYSYATNKQSTFKIDGLSNLGFQLGFVFMQ